MQAHSNELLSIKTLLSQQCPVFSSIMCLLESKCSHSKFNTNRPNLAMFSNRHGIIHDNIK